MTIVLFADRDGSALGPLGERTVPALLPLGAVPVLERMLTALVQSGVKAALVVTGPRASEVEARFGKGIRWGIALEYVRREEHESPRDVLTRLEARLDGETIVVRGDVGAHGAVAPFLAAVRGRTEERLAAVGADGRLLGLWRVAEGKLSTTEIPREPAAPSWAAGEGDTTIPLDESVPLFDSVKAYFAADRSAKAAVSDRAMVDPKAVLTGESTVSEDSAVLSGAKLVATTVLPRTVIPRDLSLQNSVVSGNLVVDGLTGEASLLTDRLPPRGGAPSSAGSRAAGVAALVLSLPLWPVAFVWSLVANAGHTTRPVTLSGNAPGAVADSNGRLPRAPFTTFRFESAVPVFRDLPLLLAVASGRLALTGSHPLTPQEEAALPEGWERVRFEAPAGLLSRARLSVPAAVPAEVVRVVEAFEARQKQEGLVSLALSNLLSSRGWLAPKVWNPNLLPNE